MRKRIVLSALLALSLIAGSASAQPRLGDCTIGPGLGATLLFPYFEVELGDPSGPTTLISINNGLGGEALVRVVLWTDWGFPTLAFDVYLEGFDIQTINLRDVFAGNLPSTGQGEDLSGFASCGTDPPFHVNPVLGANDTGQLAADHTGTAGPIFSDCAGEAHGDGIARGYVTADVVDQCSGVETASDGGPVVTPSDPTDIPYFADGGGSAGVATATNRLWGDFVFVDFSSSSAQGSDAIIIWADPLLFSGSDIFTFYGRFSDWDGRDDRVPLPNLWDQRFLNGGPFLGGADLIVFRDLGVGSQVAACGAAPTWRPLADSSVALDEDAENLTTVGAGSSFPVATQRVNVADLAIPFAFGFIQVDTDLGAWIQPTLKAGTLFSAAWHGAPVSTTCDETPPSP